MHTMMCINDFALACTFGPDPIRPFAFGAQCFFAVEQLDTTADVEQQAELLARSFDTDNRTERLAVPCQTVEFVVVFFRSVWREGRLGQQ